MLLQSTVTDPTALDGSQNSRLGTNSSGAGLPPTVGYPYAVSASLYPTPSQVNSSSTTKLLQLVSLGTSLSSFGLLNASGPSSGTNQLWYSIGTYGPVTAEAILKNSPCVSGTRSGGNCINTPTVPILWSSPALVVSDSSAITSDALVADGSNLYAAATSSTSTSIYASVNGGATWTVLASSITGTIGGLVANSTDVVVVTHSTLGGAESTVTSLMVLDGYQANITNPSALPGWLVPGATDVKFLDAQDGSSLVSGFVPWLEGFEADPNSGLAAIMITFATAAYVVDTLFDLKIAYTIGSSPFASGGSFSPADFLKDEGLAIGLTILTWLLYYYASSSVMYLVSIFTDVFSLVYDAQAAKDLAGGSEEFVEIGAISDGIDTGANVVGLWQDLSSLHVALFG
jgi:hypothetical protein